MCARKQLTQRFPQVNATVTNGSLLHFTSLAHKTCDTSKPVRDALVPVKTEAELGTPSATFRSSQSPIFGWRDLHPTQERLLKGARASKTDLLRDLGDRCIFDQKLARKFAAYIVNQRAIVRSTLNQSSAESSFTQTELAHDSRDPEVTRANTIDERAANTLNQGVVALHALNQLPSMGFKDAR